MRTLTNTELLTISTEHVKNLLVCLDQIRVCEANQLPDDIRGQYCNLAQQFAQGLNAATQELANRANGLELPKIG